ncbi:hypothetical protein [Anditalea andensis]|nr:hypothetical protein [Anditalea andensis]
MEELVIYSNDFSTNELRNIISKEGIQEFNGEAVLGFFNNDSFDLNLFDLPSHNMVRINIDLYIHDSWEGNSRGENGPDVWKMLVEDELIVSTSFSNSICEPSFCLYQSYPENGLRQFEPKTGAIISDLPGRCLYKDENGWTSKYKISKIVPHHNSTLIIKCFDELIQLNESDPKCDESWSVSKIEVSLLNIR